MAKIDRTTALNKLKYRTTSLKKPKLAIRYFKPLKANL